MSPTNFQDLAQIHATGIQIFWAAYSAVNANYIAIATVLVVVLFSIIMSDLSQKLQLTKELKDVKKAWQCVMNDVSHTEVACLTQDFSTNTTQDDATETETPKCSTCATKKMHSTQSAPEQKNKSSISRCVLPCKNTSNKEVTIMSFFYTDFVEGVTDEQTSDVDD